MNRPNLYFILNDDKNPVPVEGHVWSVWFHYQYPKRIVKKDNLFEGTPNPVKVSTVFVGLNRGINSPSGPLLFETMIFGSTDYEYQTTYATWDEALQGHNHIVQQMLEKGTLDD